LKRVTPFALLVFVLLISAIIWVDRHKTTSLKDEHHIFCVDCHTDREALTMSLEADPLPSALPSEDEGEG